jgi:hypothetical protein
MQSPIDLDYQRKNLEPLPSPPVEFELISTPIKADLFFVLRAACLTPVLVCLAGFVGQANLAWTTGITLYAEFDGEWIRVMVLHPNYAPRLEGDRPSRPNFISSILDSAPRGGWPHARWIALPFWLPFPILLVAFWIVHHLTRLE